MAPTTYKRRRFIVKPAFQYRLVAWMMGIFVMALLVFGADIYISLRRASMAAGWAFTVSDLYDPANPFTIMKLVLYAAGVLTAAVVLSHRIAGPLFRFEKSLDRLKEGDLTMTIQTRDKDEFKDYCDLFNGVVGELKKKVGEDVRKAQEARRSLEALAGSLPSDAAGKVRQAAAQLGEVGGAFKL